VGRQADRGQALEDRVKAEGGTATFVAGDLSTQRGVAELAERVKALLSPRGLDALVNNLGGVYANSRSTPDGIEATFASNFVHPVLLACLLLPELQAVRGRVVQMSTGYHHLVRLTTADLTGRRWDCGMNVYGRAKLLSVQAGEVIGLRWRSLGVGWHFADPGMALTPLTRSMTARDFPWYGRFLFHAVRQVQSHVSLDWCASSTLRLLTRTPPRETGVYVLPGPLVLPWPLVGFDRRAGVRGLKFSYRWFLPEYRPLVESSTGE
jgi:NAD(P)-dependent dehydrogenase (short-subunit alcohol dehydrogenase family)